MARVPAFASGAAGADADAAELGCVTLVSPPKAWFAAFATTAKKTTNPTIVPTIDSTRPTIAGHFAPRRNSATIDRTNAIGSRIHPMINAPGMHAKMNPTTAAPNAIHDSTCGFAFGPDGSVGGAWIVVPGGGAGCGAACGSGAPYGAACGGTAGGLGSGFCAGGRLSELIYISPEDENGYSSQCSFPARKCE